MKCWGVEGEVLPSHLAKATIATVCISFSTAGYIYALSYSRDSQPQREDIALSWQPHLELRLLHFWMCLCASVLQARTAEGRDGARWSWPLSSQRPERVPQTRRRADELRETRLQPEQISRRSASPSSTWGHLTLAWIPSIWRRKRREQDSREQDKGEDVPSGRTRNVLK